MNKNKYKQQFYNEHYERIHLAVPKGMKNTIKVLANQKGMSINSYIQDLIRKDQEGFFDTMQVADKNKELISGITGNWCLIGTFFVKSISCTRLLKSCTRYHFSCVLLVYCLCITH